jgi:hypothetical protein
MGLYADFRFLHSRHNKWELNAWGNALNTVLCSLSPWVTCEGMHCVCRKRPD